MKNERGNLLLVILIFIAIVICAVLIFIAMFNSSDDEISEKLIESSQNAIMSTKYENDFTGNAISAIQEVQNGVGSNQM